jgi:hypothetical protein
MSGPGNAPSSVSRRIELAQRRGINRHGAPKLPQTSVPNHPIIKQSYKFL